MKKAAGFTLVELLITVAIISILTTIVLMAASSSRDKAADVRVRGDVAQLRWQAEIAFGGQDNSFLDWTTNSAVQDNINTLTADIDDALGTTGQTVLRESEANEYCISAPTKSQAGRHYCIDATGIFSTTDNPCPAVAPLECPT